MDSGFVTQCDHITRNSCLEQIQCLMFTILTPVSLYSPDNANVMSFEFELLCCLTRPGLRKDIRSHIRQLYSHQVIYSSIIITYYHHFRDHILIFISITNLTNAMI